MAKRFYFPNMTFHRRREKGLSVCEDQILGVFVEAAQEVFPSLFYPHSEALGSPVIWSCCHHPWLGNNIDKYGQQKQIVFRQL